MTVNRLLNGCGRCANGGAVLLLAMVFLLLLALVAAAVMQTGILEFHMAGNNQFQEEAFQRAQAIATELSGDPNNFMMVGNVGYTLCRAGDESPDCDRHDLHAPLSGEVPPGVALGYRVVRRGPLLLRGFPVREGERHASGAALFDAAIFEVDVRVAGSERRLGTARVAQGIAVRVPASPQAMR